MRSSSQARLFCPFWGVFIKRVPGPPPTAESLYAYDLPMTFFNFQLLIDPDDLFAKKDWILISLLGSVITVAIVYQD